MKTTLVVLTAILLPPAASAQWITHPVTEAWGGAVDAWPGDLDGDGDMDVLGAAYSDNAVTWWEQEGPPEPDPVILTLTPTSPAVIPSSGGILIYTAHLNNNLPAPVTGITCWTDVIPPGGMFVWAASCASVYDDGVHGCHRPRTDPEYSRRDSAGRVYLSGTCGLPGRTAPPVSRVEEL